LHLSHIIELNKVQHPTKHIRGHELQQLSGDTRDSNTANCITMTRLVVLAVAAATYATIKITDWLIDSLITGHFWRPQR